MLLMINMLGYFLGHYPQHFQLTEDQRNLILQTMMFFVWLAGGGAVFARVCHWSYVDALYFCDVTILTVGFGDFSAPNDAGRGLVFPYSVFGIIILGLMVSSIHSFANELGRDKVIKHHVEKRRVLTMDRTVSSSMELERREREELEKQLVKNRKLNISRPLSARKSTLPPPRPSTLTFNEPTPTDRAVIEKEPTSPHKKGAMSAIGTGLKRVATFPTKRQQKKTKLILMREEKDRFDAMRRIQHQTSVFKRWYALSLSIAAFGVLWCVGAVGFWKAEKNTKQLSYFESLYFCYVSLLTIGYGDFSPKSNAGKPYFIVWSLIAVPTMTILISDMGDTIIASFKRGTFVLADWTVLPKKGLYRAFIDRNPWLWKWIQKKAEEKRIKEGFPVGDEDLPPPTLEQLATDINEMSDRERAHRLSLAIRKTADDLQSGERKRYTYEEWVEFTRLIRFTAQTNQEMEETEEVEGIVQWDWIGDNSPMLADLSEPEWVLDRLCESLKRYLSQDFREMALKEERRASELGATGATVGDEAPLTGARPMDEDRNVQSPRDMHFKRPSWDPMTEVTPLAKPRPGLASPSEGLSPDWGPRGSFIRNRSRSTQGRKSSSGAGEEPARRPSQLTEEQIESLPGPERRRYRRFSSQASVGSPSARRFSAFPQ
jgi:potassium channel subfamily K